MTITGARMEGNKRICAVQGMGDLHEDISDYSDKDRSYRYTVNGGPLPFKVLRGKLAVAADGAASRVLWDVEFELLRSNKGPEVVQMLDPVYKESLETLGKRFE
jgi:hypothetical protein